MIASLRKWLRKWLRSMLTRNDQKTMSCCVKAAQRASNVPNAQTGSLLVVALPRTEPVPCQE